MPPRPGWAHAAAMGTTRAVVLSVAVVAVVTVTAIVVAVSGGAEPREGVATEGPVPSSTSTTVEEVTSTTEGGTTTTELVCRNSTDERCGDFYYDWPEADRPTVITIELSPAAPRIGELVTFTVTIDDPDGPPISRCEFFHPDAL